MSLNATLAYGWQIPLRSMIDALRQWEINAGAYKTLCIIESRRLAGTLSTDMSARALPSTVASAASLPYEVIAAIKTHLFHAYNSDSLTWCACCRSLGSSCCLCGIYHSQDEWIMVTEEARREHHLECDDCFELEMHKADSDYKRCKGGEMRRFLNFFNLVHAIDLNVWHRQSEPKDAIMIVGMTLQLVMEERYKVGPWTMDHSSPVINPPPGQVQYQATIISPSIFEVDPALTRRMCQWISLFSIRVVHDQTRAVLSTNVDKKKGHEEALALLRKSIVPKWMIVAESTLF